MDITERVTDDLTILDVNGKIVCGEGDAIIRERIKDLVANRRVKILLNLGSVGFIDSSGLGELLEGYARVRQAGGSMKLVSLTKRVQNLLAITQLLTVFDAFDDEREAVASFWCKPEEVDRTT
jgi:anti-sigma B factor antagonist